MPNYRDIVYQWSPRVLRGYWGQRLTGLLVGLVWDLTQEGAARALQAFYLIAGQPGDALPLQGEERRLRRYIRETTEQYRTRLAQFMTIWESAGNDDGIEGQYEAAGYVGAEVHSPLDWNRSPLDWPSEFWVYLPRAGLVDGSAFHFCGAGVAAGSAGAVCGTGTPFAPAHRIGTAVVGSHLIGIKADPLLVDELRYIAKNFKAGHEIVPQILLELWGHTCGTTGIAGTARCGGGGVGIGTGGPEF
jgi:hypothetical protein